ncbi:Hypothetical oxalate decarboxylase [Mycobacteroides abscessus]|nr:Hypothetical oxalate decarboxylase [Mycobacteroides abscessus]
MKSINRRTVLGGVGVAGVAAAAGAGTDWAFSPPRSHDNPEDVTVTDDPLASATPGSPPN